MTDDQYRALLSKIEEARHEAANKGHFLVLALLIAIAIKTGAC